MNFFEAIEKHKDFDGFIICPVCYFKEAGILMTFEGGYLYSLLCNDFIKKELSDIEDLARNTCITKEEALRFIEQFKSNGLMAKSGFEMFDVSEMIY